MVEARARIWSIRGAPKSVRVDNGPEFIPKTLERWAEGDCVTLDLSRPGKVRNAAFLGHDARLSHMVSK